MASVFWDRHGVILIDYLQKGKPITEAYNAPSHTSAVAMGKIAELRFELLNHPPYSPDLAPRSTESDSAARLLALSLRRLRLPDANFLDEQVTECLFGKNNCSVQQKRNCTSNGWKSYCWTVNVFERTLHRIGYGDQRPVRKPLLSALNKKLPFRKGAQELDTR
ncbi:histone-lysine N-methyltransferase SETMAR [Trichonephila clavipes]|nr:histone-lysine N-methyltransferase SETMAR [Trichonephila clavipes]